MEISFNEEYLIKFIQRAVQVKAHEYISVSEARRFLAEWCLIDAEDEAFKAIKTVINRKVELKYGISTSEAGNTGNTGEDGI